MKFHLAKSIGPLKQGSTVTALCGEDVDNAQFPFIFDLEIPDAEESASLNRLKICGDCFAIRTKGKHLLYGLANGQEIINEIGAEL